MINQETLNLLLNDMESRFSDEKGIKYDKVMERYYFKNIPNQFLLWSARNSILNQEEKEKLKELLVSNNIIFSGPANRWFTNFNTLGKFTREIYRYVSITN